MLQINAHCVPLFQQKILVKKSLGIQYVTIFSKSDSWWPHPLDTEHHQESTSIQLNYTQSTGIKSNTTISNLSFHELLLVFWMVCHEPWFSIHTKSKDFCVICYPIVKTGKVIKGYLPITFLSCSIVQIHLLIEISLSKLLMKIILVEVNCRLW